MAKIKSPFIINIEYFSVILLLKLIRLLPEWSLDAVAAILGKILWWILPKRKNIIQKNLLRAFPEKSYFFRRRIARSFWPEFSRMVIEYMRLAGMPHDQYDSVFIWENEHYYEEAKSKHKGVIIVSAHFSNWELYGMALSIKGYLTASVARPLDNPKFDRLINSIRESSGMQVVPHRKAVKEALKILKKDQSIGFVMDQNFHHGGVFVNFFGHPAAITDLPAILALKTGAPLLPVHTWREGSKFHAKLDSPIFVDAPENANLSAQEISQKIADIMEGWIKEKPVYWLWAHGDFQDPLIFSLFFFLFSGYSGINLYLTIPVLNMM